jgi:hypothetical protein
MYILKRADESHKDLGACNGVLGPGRDDTFWIIGWPPATLEQVTEQLVCTLVFPSGRARSVEVKQIDRDGERIRFEFTG